MKLIKELLLLCLICVFTQAFREESEGAESDEVAQSTNEGKPDDPPSNVRCETLSSDEIRVSWEDVPVRSLHGTFDSYKVYYHWSYIPDKPADDIAFKMTEDNEIVLHGLKKNALYAIRVLVTSLSGDSTLSDVIRCKTDTDGIYLYQLLNRIRNVFKFSVPDEPFGVKVIINGTNKALVLWRPPLEQNGDILNYTIFYRIKGGELKTRKTFGWSYEIEGLEPNQTYEFWVAANTKDGEGLNSEYITRSTNHNRAPQIITYDQVFYVQFKENAILPCEAFGSPAPTTTWKVLSSFIHFFRIFFSNQESL